MSTTAQQVPTGTFTIDPIHSTASSAVKHLGISTFRSSFKEFDAKLEGGVLTGSVKVDSIDIDLPDLKGHVLSGDFFDAETHPTIDFRSTTITVADGGAASVEGELTIRGTTLPVVGTGSFAGPITGLGGDTRVAIELEAEIDRTKFGLTWNADLPQGGKALAEQVKLIVHLELVEQAA
ncbi:YceI family protein [Conexibacter sp. SYSU D00693]|uniref:YceI family protein n=1 Tax=Conexibacter sp. SYSU D00693 TaxID=2812560 RepID=UPI00196A2D39|nr:YceI family protein [Conexibacter sp. SYSU D00693]